MKKNLFVFSLLFAFGTATAALKELPDNSSGLDSVFAPIRVAPVPSDAYIGLSMLETGEIRHYNYGEQADAGTFYWSSMDKGLTWRKISYPRDMLFADRRSPVSNEYIRLVAMGNMGTYCIRTQGGIEGGRILTKISDTRSIMLKPPVFIRNGKRIVVAGHGGVTPKGCYTYVSDDDGASWRQSTVVTAPDHRAGGFHKGIRWNHGAVEPTVVELKDGRLWMLMRTAQDRHYESFSEDGGLTWSESRPSMFYGTITMPTMERLSDGRLLFFWCNTTPLPEMETATGVWDDVFTNRDATHVAISEDDGKTWIGFRELRLNPNRNDRDYASNSTGIDRSVHQAQCIEVAPNKILVATGQHTLLRAMYLFDTEWLYEKECYNDFSDGLDRWSVFNYVKGIKGHCAYDRIAGCELVDHPEKKDGKMLHVRYIPDSSLVADTRGAVWNFPAMKKGSFKTRIRLPKGGKELFLLLNDRWMNPSDTVARYECVYELELSCRKLGLQDDKWHDLSLSWDLNAENSFVQVYVDGRRRNIRIPLKHPSEAGISYVHFMAAPAEENPGVFIEWVKGEQSL